MNGSPILSLLTFLPALGALVIFFCLPSGEKNSAAAGVIKKTAFAVTLITFLLSLTLWTGFDYTTMEYQFVEKYSWIDSAGIGYHVGIDGISLYLILLTTFLMPLCILASWKTVKTQLREYVICFLLLETLIIGVFVSLDFLMFYLFFEASLIPMFLIIGIWGGDNRIYASFKFFLYTLLGSVLLLLALLYLYFQFGTTDIELLTQKSPELGLEVQKWLWLAFFASFAVKVPMWPVHTWLPDAHVQAPTAGSMILAGILLKLGGYGFLRFSLPMLPDASQYFAPFMYTLSVIAVIYTSLVALMQKDMKKLIAYSSIAHMGFVTAGIFALNAQAVEGAIFQMISHGLVSAALFFCVGVLYDRAHTKEIAYYGGVASRMPTFAFYFMFFSMASIGLPATSGFVGEFLILLGVFKSSTLTATLMATGVILGAAYMLWLYARVMFGEITNKEVRKLKDVNIREWAILTSLGVLALFYGIYPSALLNGMHTSVEHLLQQVAGN